MPKTKNKWIAVAWSNVEVDGPFECPLCQGHVVLDATFLDQVNDTVTCPYCNKRIKVPKEWVGT